MLKITVPGQEFFDGEEFTHTKDQTLQLEHSLVSVSKWEAKWHKPFLSEKPLSHEEFVDYIRCMTITQNVNPTVYLGLTAKNLKEVSAYLNESMTATTFPKNQRGRREIITAEIIYYWMVSYGIPFECQKWHLNKLLTLINVCNAKSQKPKKMSKAEIFAQNRAINAARRKRFNSRG